jgi:hypothetical protein
MILWTVPSTRAQPTRAAPSRVQSIKQPQLDLHSRLHNLGTYRVKAPGRDPLWRPGWKEQAMPPLMADQPTGAGDPGRRSSVMARLTPNRRRRPVENDEYASFIRRVIRAHARRVAAGDVDALADMTGLATELDEAIALAVIGLREAGYTWAEIAAQLGVSRQAAQQRWGQRQ